MCTGEVQINDNIYRSKVIKMVKTESEDFFYMNATYIGLYITFLFIMARIP